MKKISLFFVLLLFLFTFILASEEASFNFEDTTIVGNGINFYSENRQIAFIEDDACFSINGNEFCNILSAKSSRTYSELGALPGIWLNEKGEINSFDFITTERGGTYNLSGFVFEVPGNSRVKLIDGEFILPGESKILDIGKSKFIVNLEASSGGGDVELWNGVTLDKGSKFFFEEGKIGLLSGDCKGITFMEDECLTGGINKVNIFSKLEEEPPMIVFEKSDCSQQADCFIFGEDSFEFIKGSDFHLINSRVFFTSEGSPYLDVEKGDFLEISSSFKLTKRDENGLIPLLEIGGDEFTGLNNGGNMIFFGSSSGRYYLSSYKSSHSPVPVEVHFFDKRLLMDNFGRVALINEDPEVLEGIAKDSEGANHAFLVSSRLKYNHIEMEDIKHLLGDIDVSFTFMEDPRMHKFLNLPEANKGQESLALGRLRDYLGILDDDTRQLIKNIYVGDFSVLFMDTVAFTIPPKGELGFRLNTESLSLPVFMHEVTHLKHFALQNQTKLTEEYKHYHPENEFDAKWISLSGGLEMYSEDYSGYHVYLDSIGGLSKREVLNLTIFNKDFNEVPKKGFVRAYGATEYCEDITTFVQQIFEEPSFFKKNGLIVKGSPNYDPTYKSKIDLLLEYGFISQKEYDAVFE